MSDRVGPLTVIGTGWKGFEQRLADAIAPLTAEQLALPAASHHWSIGELARHIVVNRVWWFHSWMGEGDAGLARIADWNPKQGTAGPVPSASELIAALEATWDVIEDGLSRWTAADLADQPAPPATATAGERRAFGGRTRQWMIWHVLEHELMHAGEISLALGSHGLPTIRPI